MKKSEYRNWRHKPVRTMKQLRLEKQQLQHKIDLKELEIRQDYRNLIGALSFRTIITAIADDILVANTVISKVVDVIRRWFRRRRPSPPTPPAP